MKLLVVVDYFSDPPIHGTAVIAHHWARRLRERGHRVDLLVVREPPDPSWTCFHETWDVGAADIGVRRRPLPLRAWSPLVGVPQSLLHFDADDIAGQVVRQGYHGAVLISHYMVGLAERLKEVMPVVFAPVDSPSLMLGSRLDRWGAPWQKAWWRFERRIWRRVEDRRFRELPAVVYVSPADAEHATRGWDDAARQRVQVIPNGVDAAYFRPDFDARTAARTGAQAATARQRSEQAEPAELVFTGILATYDSVGGALWFMDHVLPRVLQRVPEARFRMVGRAPASQLVERARREPRVKVHGDVPDLRPYLQRAGVYVCPLLTGAGIKNRLLEALAMEKPVVSTGKFPGTMGLEHEKHLLTADTPSAFADAVVRLIRDRALAERLGREGRRFVVERFSWEAGVEKVEELLVGQ